MLRTTVPTVLTATVLALGLPTLLAGPAQARSASDLEQEIEVEQPVVTGERVLTGGHVDMGPRLVDGEWAFLVHDDVAKADPAAQSVWRYPDETVLHVLDEAELAVPDDPAYEFLGVPAGDPVWVVPQTQDPDVVWLGWNTQDPDVMATIDRGVTLSLTGVQGPGDVSVYLQSGSFGEPQVLWDSREQAEQPVWVDVNTHTHANWVFTEPGTYLLQLRADADLVDGSQVSDTQLLRVAVGTQTSVDATLAAAWQDADGGGAAVDGAAAEDTDEAAGAAAGRDLMVPVLVGAIVVVALGLVVGVAVAALRGSRTRRRVLAARRPDGPAPAGAVSGGPVVGPGGRA